MRVKKRNGKVEDLDYEKIHKVIDWAGEGLVDVSTSQVEIGAKIQFSDLMETSNIHDMLIKSAVNLIDETHRDYAKLSARLLLFKLRKEVYGKFEPYTIKEMFKHNVEIGVYDKVLAEYTDEEYERLENIVDHSRDLNYEYAGLTQVIQKYLVKDRSKKGVIYETPQVAYLAMSCIFFGKDLDKIETFYNQASLFKFSLPTPIMGGVRTPTRQFSSCVLIDSGDSLDSIADTGKAIMKYVSQRAGIGVNVGRIRSIGSKIRNGEVEHTGLLPFLKYLRGALKSCSQGGIRGGAATTFYPWWHKEYETLIMLKNENGIDETRERQLDYGVQFNKFFFDALINDEEVHLFSPHDVPELYEAFFLGNNTFIDEYTKAINNPFIHSKVVKAKDLATEFIEERVTTGRIYVQFVDNIYDQGMYDEAVYQSNLCMEIVLPTSPLDISKNEGKIQLCTLASLNLDAFDDPVDMKDSCEILVEALNNLLDYQDYPIDIARRTTMDYRPLGVGVINLATLLAKNGFEYGSKEGLELVDKYLQHMSYYLINKSCELNKHYKNKNDKSIYNHGKLPFEFRNDNVDKLVEHKLYDLDWSGLKTRLIEHGIANTALMAVAPTESSSQILNATNGIEMPRMAVSKKGSKDGLLTQVVPNLPNDHEFQYLFDQVGCQEYLKTVAVIQKYIDQSISTNTFYNPNHYPNNEISETMLLSDVIYAHKLGIKTLYYSTLNDQEERDVCEGCVV